MPSAAVWRDALVAVFVVSVLPFVGTLTLAWHGRAVRRAAPLLVCFGLGALLGAACFQLIPEALANAPAPRVVPLLVVLGAAASFALEWVLHTAHGHHNPTRAGPGCAAHGSAAHGSAAHSDAESAGGRPRPLVALTLLGDALHNLLDGMLIGATFLAGAGTGLLATLAVALHEVPRELGTFGVYVHAGASARRAVVFNALTAVVAAAGAVLTLAVGARAAGLATSLVPVAAGNFLYVGLSLLKPALAPAAPAPRPLRLALFAFGVAATSIPAMMF